MPLIGQRFHSPGAPCLKFAPITVREWNHQSYWAQAPDFSIPDLDKWHSPVLCGLIPNTCFLLLFFLPLFLLQAPPIRRGWRKRREKEVMTEKLGEHELDKQNALRRSNVSLKPRRLQAWNVWTLGRSESTGSSFIFECRLAPGFWKERLSDLNFLKGGGAWSISRSGKEQGERRWKIKY